MLDEGFSKVIKGTLLRRNLIQNTTVQTLRAERLLVKRAGLQRGARSLDPTPGHPPICV